MHIFHSPPKHAAKLLLAIQLFLQAENHGQLNSDFRAWLVARGLHNFSYLDNKLSNIIQPRGCSQQPCFSSEDDADMAVPWHFAACVVLRTLIGYQLHP